MEMSYSFNHDVDSVFGLLTDPDFLVERAMALGDLSVDCEVNEEGDTTGVNMIREVSRELPAFLGKLFSSQQVLELEERWHSTGANKSGSFLVRVLGHPVSIQAEFSLKQTNTGCNYVLDPNAKVKIPLIAGKIEKYINSHTKEEFGTRNGICT